MYLTGLKVKDNDEIVLEMGEKDLNENRGLVTFTIDEDPERRDIVIIAKDIVGNEQKIVYENVLITSEKKIIDDAPTPQIAVPTEPNGGNITNSDVSIIIQEDNRLLYVVTFVMIAAILITGAGVYFKRRHKGGR